MDLQVVDAGADCIRRASFRRNKELRAASRVYARPPQCGPVAAREYDLNVDDARAHDNCALHWA